MKTGFISILFSFAYFASSCHPTGNPEKAFKETHQNQLREHIVNSTESIRFASEVPLADSPELVRFSGGEYVFNTKEETQRFLASMFDGFPVSSGPWSGKFSFILYKKSLSGRELPIYILDLISGTNIFHIWKCSDNHTQPTIDFSSRESNPDLLYLESAAAADALRTLISNRQIERDLTEHPK